MKRLLSIALIATTFFACSKDNTTNPNSQECVITEITNSDASKTSFNYNSEGKISSATYVNEGQTFTYTISYSDSRIYIAETRNGSSSDTYSYALSNGKISSKVSSYGMHKFIYDTDGYLSSISYDDDTKITLSYSAGNLTQLKSSYNNQIFTVGYSSKDSRVPFSEFHFNVFTEWGPTAMFEDALLYEQGYFGNRVKNQITSLKVGNEFVTYSFVIDSQGKITSGKSDHNNLSFKYDCK